MKKTLLVATILFGLWLLSSSGYMLMKAELSQYLIKEAWNKSIFDKQNHKPWSWADTYPIMYLNVPRIGKSSYILQGGSNRNMAFSVVHLDPSGMPGEKKSTILSGHKDSHFDYLKELKIGDEIVTQDKNTSHVFRVTSMNIVNSKSKAIAIRNTNELILTTCYPFSDFEFGGDLRYIVHASPIDNRGMVENM